MTGSSRSRATASPALAPQLASGRKLWGGIGVRVGRRAGGRDSELSRRGNKKEAALAGHGMAAPLQRSRGGRRVSKRTPTEPACAPHGRAVAAAGVCVAVVGPRGVPGQAHQQRAVAAVVVLCVRRRRRWWAELRAAVRRGAAGVETRERVGRARAKAPAAGWRGTQPGVPASGRMTWGTRSRHALLKHCPMILKLSRISSSLIK